jgi:hypothetical protein
VELASFPEATGSMHLKQKLNEQEIDQFPFAIAVFNYCKPSG